MPRFSKPRQALRQFGDFDAAGLLSESQRADFERVAERYAVAVTPEMAALIDPADPQDPIARQFVPAAAELRTTPQERADPIGDEAHSPLPGLVHRYPDRVLLKLVNVCAVYCRFCFRREMVGPGAAGLSPAQFAAALDYIRARPAIWEVILSGGDPLVLSARRIRTVMEQFARIPHLKVVRLHTRIPAVDPGRVTPALVRALRVRGQATYVVLHANHPRELTPAARAACARLVDAGIPMLSQTVLLRGVNDSVATLSELMRAFVECRIKPYYLHHADLAPGTAHLRTTVAEGQALMRALRGHVSGLCQPEYVLDIPGGHGKSPIGPTFLAPPDGTDSSLQVRDFRGGLHSYVEDQFPPRRDDGD
ncbi:MAG: lysine-2,3-aminomutase-like protein [Variibacter sp.]|nr:lysine-2,3-aminomutase-like protein [Variibacter sp.]